MSYESFVENYRTQKRQLIIPWWGFVLAAVFVISVLLLLNQSQEAFAFDLYDQPADETALRYIDNMLQTKPDDMSLRLQRIHQLIGLEELETAREEIDLISDASQIVSQFLDITKKRGFSIEPGQIIATGGITKLLTLEKGQIISITNKSELVLEFTK